MKILGSDWRTGAHAGFRIGLFGKPKWLSMPGKFLRERINFDKIAAIEHITQENQASIGGALGWGAAGAALLGPVGLVAGVMLGGKKERRIMALRFIDGRSVLLECPSKEFKWLLGLAHSAQHGSRAGQSQNQPPAI